jgi:hypothetical protein
MEESPHHFRVFRVALVGIQKSKHFQKQTDISPKSGKKAFSPYTKTARFNGTKSPRTKSPRERFELKRSLSICPSARILDVCPADQLSRREATRTCSFAYRKTCRGRIKKSCMEKLYEEKRKKREQDAKDD